MGEDGVLAEYLQPSFNFFIRNKTLNYYVY